MDAAEEIGYFQWGYHPEIHSVANEVHPEDLAAFAAQHKYTKLYRKRLGKGGYIELESECGVFRVRPFRFLSAKKLAALVGEKVRVWRKREAVYQIGVVNEVSWHFKRQEAIYYLSFDGKKASRRYFASEFERLAIT